MPVGCAGARATERSRVNGVRGPPSAAAGKFPNKAAETAADFLCTPPGLRDSRHRHLDRATRTRQARRLTRKCPHAPDRNPRRPEPSRQDDGRLHGRRVDHCRRHWLERRVHDRTDGRRDRPGLSAHGRVDRRHHRSQPVRALWRRPGVRRQPGGPRSGDLVSARRRQEPGCEGRESLCAALRDVRAADHGRHHGQGGGRQRPQRVGPTDRHGVALRQELRRRPVVQGRHGWAHARQCHAQRHGRTGRALRRRRQARLWQRRARRRLLGGRARRPRPDDWGLEQPRRLRPGRGHLQERLRRHEAAAARHDRADAARSPRPRPDRLRPHREPHRGGAPRSRGAVDAQSRRQGRRCRQAAGCERIRLQPVPARAQEHLADCRLRRLARRHGLLCSRCWA
jgi:hypothetical protein